MKFIVFILGFLLIAGCATFSATSSPTKIDGAWEGVYDTGEKMASPLSLLSSISKVMGPL
jgi:hypothetical protein